MLFKKISISHWLWSYFGIFIICILIQLLVGSITTILMTAFSFSAFYILCGIGQMAVISSGPGNIDLSIPSVIVLAGFIAMKTMNSVDGLIGLGFLLAISSGLVFGCFNYFLIRICIIPPIIATLASGFILRTAAMVYSGGNFIKPPRLLELVINFKIGVIPLLVIFAVVVSVIFYFALQRRSWGRKLSAVGQNEWAACLAGINVTAIRLSAYIISSVMAALTGVLLAAFSGGASLNMGNEYMLISVAVVVLGGTDINGGRGNVQGLIGASLLLYLIINLLNIIGVSIGVRQIITGLIILIIITLSSGKKG